MTMHDCSRAACVFVGAISIAGSAGGEESASGIAFEMQAAASLPGGQAFPFTFTDSDGQSVSRRVRLSEVVTASYPLTVGLGYRFARRRGGDLTLGASFTYALAQANTRGESLHDSLFFFCERADAVCSAGVKRASLRLANHYAIDETKFFTMGLRIGPEFLDLRLGRDPSARMTWISILTSELDVALDFEVADRMWVSPFVAASYGAYDRVRILGETHSGVQGQGFFERLHFWYSLGVRFSFVR